MSDYQAHCIGCMTTEGLHSTEIELQKEVRTAKVDELGKLDKKHDQITILKNQPLQLNICQSCYKSALRKNIIKKRLAQGVSLLFMLFIALSLTMLNLELFYVVIFAILSVAFYILSTMWDEIIENPLVEFISINDEFARVIAIFLGDTTENEIDIEKARTHLIETINAKLMNKATSITAVDSKKLKAILKKPFDFKNNEFSDLFYKNYTLDRVDTDTDNY